MPISKKTALITDCSDGGIGDSMAKVLHEKGYYVFATLRNVSKAGALAEIDNVEILELNVTLKESIARYAQEVRNRTGGTLDILINNAGSDFLMPLLDMDIEEARKYFDANFWGVFAVTQAFAPMVVNAKRVIVNHSSVVWNLYIPWGGVYSSSKAAVKQFSEILRVELEPLGVRVVTSIIGAVDTPIFANSHPDPFELPAESYYKPVKQFIMDQRDGKKQPPMSNVDVVARQMVDDILSGSTGCIWRGAASSDARWLSWLLPTWAAEMVTNGTRGLKELKRYYMNKSE